MQALRQLFRRFPPEQRRFIKFCVVGGTGVVVNLAFAWIGKNLVFSWMAGERSQTMAAWSLGILVSIFTNFILNDYWTWGDRRETSARTFMGRLLRFYVVCALGSAVQFGTAYGLRFAFHVHYLLAALCGVILATALNYGMNNVWTFRHHHGGKGAAPARAGNPKAP